ncbi:ComF family protein [Kangiella sp. TOML190]|uniref:ComF family protein n=1 Tax=Kangiella sp. TOML190 TaxID=2931351 RepID=UPI002041E16E|nr:ComF family protein [Kangiella sp. TOML190]
MVYQRFYRVLRRSANRIMAGHACAFCQQDCAIYAASTICSSCREALIRQGYYCYQCGYTLTSNSVQFCGACLKKPKQYQRLIAACDYEFPVDKAISEIKFNRQWHLARALSYLLLEKITQAYQDSSAPDLLIPIPLHRKRLSERGFNQAELIAKRLAKRLQLPMDNKSLIRIKNTPHQIGLKAAQRRKNLKGAFVAQSNLPTHIALIDDVVTTSSTISEATKACLTQGAEQVDIWCLAKT